MSDAQTIPEPFKSAPAPPIPAVPARVSIVIPALNEADNLPELLERINAALPVTAYEVIIVDDGSRDGTPQVCASLSRRYPLRLDVRADRSGGLSGAVLHGLNLARGEIFVVMDADLQHPPEVLPELIHAIEHGDSDFALGSRHVPGGSTAEQWGVFRRINSRVATTLARPFAGPTQDPMSGFFALNRETFNRARKLTPLGYKIGLELMCKCGVERIKEIPIHFDTRTAGESKLTVAQQFKYLEHLSRLYDFCYPRLSPVAKFLTVMTLGWFIALGTYGAVLMLSNLKPFVAAPIAYLAMLLVTLIFHIRYVRTQRPFLLSRWPWRDFAAVALAEWSACTLTAWWMAGRLRQTSGLEVFLITFGVAVVARYVLRKELLLDLRGLRRSYRSDEINN